MIKLCDEKAKEKIPYLLTGLALCCGAILSGGLSWQNCIFPLLILLMSIVLIGRIRDIRYAMPLILLIVLCCISAFISMGNPQISIYETYKFMCFVAAVTVGYLLKSETSILKIIFFNALIVAAFGILACCGIINFAEFTFKDGSIVRLQSFIKYANVTACFLGCGYIAFLELFITEKKNTYLYAGSCILIAMYFTFSKACLPIFLIVSSLYIYKKKELSKIFLVQNIVAVVLLIIMLIIVPMKMYFILFILITVGIVISGKINKNHDRCFSIWMLILGTLTVSAIIVVILKPSLSGTFTKRIEYMKDSVKLIQNNPLFGCGFGSWRVLQYKVQTEQYNVTFLHNGILQMIVENGIVFTVTFLSMISYAVINAIKNKKYHLVVIVLTVLIHSLIDCDLSFGVILIVLGLTIGRMLPERVNVKSYNRIMNYLLVTFLCVSNLYMITEYTLRYSFEKSYVQNDYNKAANKLDKLVLICPLDAQLKVTEAAIEEKTTNNKKIIHQKLEEAINLSPYDPDIYENYMNHSLQEDNIEKLCMKYIEISPKQERTYAFLKQYLIKANKNKIISDETYSLIYEKIENRRIEEDVIDRNELLNQIVNDEK